VSTSLAYVTATEAAELRQTQFRVALDSRDVIGQAKGILMERRGLPADQAFDVLRRASQDLNVKLRDVAATLAERRADL
jgi:AmiR/NasT family two-component response regulator